MKKTVALVILIYFIVVSSFFIYFGLLQQFGVEGLVFNIGGRDHTVTPLDALILVATVAALFLLVISLIAFKRTKDTRILIISIAFFFFAVKEFLFMLENFFPGEFIYIDNAERALELLILLSFVMLMYGTHRREQKKIARKQTRNTRKSSNIRKTSIRR